MSDLLQETRKICQLMEIKPKHSKGQNFLINDKIYQKIVQSADLKQNDIVLEVGPGLGFLTVKLAAKVKKVLAVELDSQLANYLKIGVDSQDLNNIEVINKDILNFNPFTYPEFPKKYKIVANLPYNISSIFLRRFLSSEFPPESLVLMLQKEVVFRITAQVPEMSVLALAVQYYAQAELIKIVKAGNFWPEPKVDSAILKLVFKKKKYTPDLDQRFFRIVKIGFSSKRKMLKNNLVAGLRIEAKKIEEIFKKQGLKIQARAQELTLKEWQKLFADLDVFMVK